MAAKTIAAIVSLTLLVAGVSTFTLASASPWYVYDTAALSSALNEVLRGDTAADQPVDEIPAGGVDRDRDYDDHSHLARAFARPDDGLLAPNTARAGAGSIDDLAGVADDLCRVNSFVPATLVLMADGTTKRIADVLVGDMVMAADPETGERGPRRVDDTIVGDGVKELVDIEVKGDVITATDRHPFWVDDEGRWVNAEDLERGDVLLLADGQTALVERVVERTEVRRVHNLTVDGIHTYFVLAGEDPVLVHNCTGTPRPPRRPQKPSDPPSWVRQGGHCAETTDLNPAGAARRIFDEQYGPGGWSGTGAGSEFSQTQKWLSRYFEWG